MMPASIAIYWKQGWADVDGYISDDIAVQRMPTNNEFENRARRWASGEQGRRTLTATYLTISPFNECQPIMSLKTGRVAGQVAGRVTARFI